MSVDIKEILEAEQHLENLLSKKKDEIFDILKSCGGITLSNELLAGLALYAANPSNKNSSFLQELSDLGSSKIPSKKNRKSRKETKSPYRENRISEDSAAKEKVNG